MHTICETSDKQKIAQNVETNDDLNNDPKKHNEPIELFTFDTYIKHVWQKQKGNCTIPLIRN